MLEVLEQRQLFSVSASAFHETLYVWGDNQNNGLSVAKEGSDLVAKKYVQGSGYVEFFRTSDASVDYVRVYGYAGLDTISISDNVLDEVTVFGGKGADWIKGGGGTSNLWGHGNWAGDPDHGPASDDSSADTLVSGKGYTVAYGQKGNDTFITDETGAGSNYDVMSGGDGNDTFYVNGQGNAAYCFGEAGADTFVAKQTATQQASFYGGAGWDRVDYKAWTSAVWVQPDGVGHSGLRWGERRQIIQNDVEFVEGTNQADYFWGSSGANTFYGWGGDDIMYGNGGNDLLVGQTGNDSIYGGSGDDYLVGSEGNDTIFGGSGNDQMYGNQGNDDMHGDAGNDKIYGQEDSDWLYGDAGSDLIVGGQGSDYLVSHDGVLNNDIIRGDNEDGTGGAGSFDVAYIDKTWPFSDITIGVESVSS